MNFPHRIQLDENLAAIPLATATMTAGMKGLIAHAGTGIVHATDPETGQGAGREITHDAAPDPDLGLDLMSEADTPTVMDMNLHHPHTTGILRLQSG